MSWKATILVLLFGTFTCCRGITVLRCCKVNEDVHESEIEDGVSCSSSLYFFQPLISSSETQKYVREAPSFWRIRDDTLPQCGDSAELKFIPWSKNIDFTLYDSGNLLLKIDSPKTVNFTQYCLANNGLMICHEKPRRLRKCCGEHGVYDRSECIINEELQLSMKEDLHHLLRTEKLFFDIFNIHIISGFPHCHNDRRVLHHFDSLNLRYNASLEFNGKHMIPADQFCIERTKVNGRYVPGVVTCHDTLLDILPHSSDSHISRSNIFISLLLACLHYFLKIIH